MLNAYSTCLGPITGTPGGELACVENVNEYFYECFNHGNLFQCFFNKTTQSVCLDLRPQMTLCWRRPRPVSLLGDPMFSVIPEVAYHTVSLLKTMY